MWQTFCVNARPNISLCYLFSFDLAIAIIITGSEWLIYYGIIYRICYQLLDYYVENDIPFSPDSNSALISIGVERVIGTSGRFEGLKFIRKTVFLDEPDPSVQAREDAGKTETPSPASRSAV